MSNFFVKNELFDSVTESSINLPNTIKIIDNNNQNGGDGCDTFLNNQQKGGNNYNYSVTSSISRSQLNNNYSETSSIQKGGNNYNYSATSSVLMSKMNDINYSVTSSLNNKQNGGAINKQNGGENNIQSNGDINKLLSMLTSESDDSESTSTISLENKLVNMLESPRQSGGENKINSNDLKKYFYDLKSNGVKVDIKLNDKSLSEFLNLAQNTTTEINKNEMINKLMDSHTSEFMPINQNENNINTTTSSSNFLMDGGSKKNKHANDDEEEVEFNLLGGKSKRTPSEAFLAFGKLKNHVADKLKIPRSKIAMQIASAVLKDIKSKNEGISTIDAVEEGIKLFDKKKDYYYDMFKK